MIRYTTDGSTPNATSTLWDSTGPREPGEVFHITADHHVQVAGDGHQGQPVDGLEEVRHQHQAVGQDLDPASGPPTAGRSPGPARARGAGRGGGIGRAARPPRRRGEGGGPVAVDLDECSGLLSDDVKDCWIRSFQAVVERQGRSQAGGRGDRAGRQARGRLSALELPRRHAHGGADVRARAGRDARRPEGLPAAEQRSRLQRRLRARARDRRGAVDRPAGAARGGDGLRGRDDPLPALQLRPRARACVHADLQRPAEAGARPLLRPRPAGGARLRAGRLPRLLVRGCRRRRRVAARATAVTDPSELCGSQPAAFVRPCWYRAFVDNRPAGIVPDSPEYFEVLCKGLAGLQREACITAVSVIGAGRSGGAARALRAAPGSGRSGELRPRHEGAEPARRADRRPSSG